MITIAQRPNAHTPRAFRPTVRSGDEIGRAFDVYEADGAEDYKRYKATCNAIAVGMVAWGGVGRSFDMDGAKALHPWFKAKDGTIHASRDAADLWTAARNVLKGGE